MREPSFWWEPVALSARLLGPAASMYGAVAAWRMARAGSRAVVPVVCVGNLTLGGAGKTPAAIAIAALLAQAGSRPVFLTRGYGGRLAGPLRVARDDRACEVGDEPLLLARHATTIVARDRVAGAALAVAEGADVIVMDDGLQNPALAKDFSLAVIDARRGIGNGRVFPAGPLRAPLAAQLAQVHALVLVGDPSPASARVLAIGRTLPILTARLVPDATAAALRETKVLAFAGIADPEKFFATVAAAGIPAPVTKSFPDHHPFTAAEAAELLARAERDGLQLLTTEKDLCRMAGDPALAALAAGAKALPVTLAFDDEDLVQRLLAQTLRG